MDKYKDKAITIIQTLINATGAEFEDQNMAIDIISDNLEKELKINVGLADVSHCKCNEPVKCDNCGAMAKKVITGEICSACYC